MNKIALIVVFFIIQSIACFPDFYLYNHENRNQRLNVTASKMKEVLNTKCKCYSEIIFIVHGFRNSGHDEWVIEMKDALLDQSKARTVIAVDWKSGAGGIIYPDAALNVKYNGQRIAQFIKDAGINPKIVHCIGHSLGAHSCGMAGKHVKLGRISGMDPAGPLFTNKPSNERLDKADADFVDVLHTDICQFGIHISVGHVDFFPNGGKNQPDCTTWASGPSKCDNLRTRRQTATKNNLINGKCNHAAAVTYYTESIRNPDATKFQAMRTNRYIEYEKYRTSGVGCDRTACAQMGYGSILAKNFGDYHLTIN